MTIDGDSSSRPALIPHIEALRVPAHAVGGFGELLSLELAALDLPPGTRELLEGLSTSCEEFIGQLGHIEHLAEAYRDTEIESSPEAPHLPSIEPIRVLIVDDSPANQLLTSAQLERLNVESESVTSGEAAIEVLTTEKFSLVLMDWHMPGLDGLETTAKIRARERSDGSRPQTIVALTARAMVGDKERCLEVGMDDFLAKPVSLDDLRRVIETHTATSHTADSEAPSRPEASPHVVVAVSDIQEARPESAVNAVDTKIYKALVADIGNEEIVKTLADTFRQELVERLEEFDRARLGSDAELMRRAVHTIKGTSALLGAIPLSECAAEAEELCRQGRVPVELATQLHQLAVATDQALAALTSNIASTSDTQTTVAADRAA